MQDGLAFAGEGIQYACDLSLADISLTNLEYEDWYNFLGRKEMVGALLDRLRHRCHAIRVEGQSMREPQT